MSAKKNPQRYVSDGELQAVKRGISREMFEKFEAVWMTVMRDKFGFGADRLEAIMIDTHAIGEAMLDDKLTVDSMQADLRELRRVRIPDAYFIKRPMGRGELYWTAADQALTGGRMYRESDIRNLRIRAERDTWVICESIWLYTLQLPRRQDPFGETRLRRAQAEARALGESIHDHRITVEELRDVLRDETHIILQRPEPREKDVGGKQPFDFGGTKP